MSNITRYLITLVYIKSGILEGYKGSSQILFEHETTEDYFGVILPALIERGIVKPGIIDVTCIEESGIFDVYPLPGTDKND